MNDVLNSVLGDLTERVKKIERRLALLDTQDMPGNLTAGAPLFGSTTGKITTSALNTPVSYTPTYTGSTTAGVTTYSLQQGWYWQFGTIVFVTGALAWTAATGTGNAQISLPFTPNGSYGFRASGGMRTSNVTFTTTTPMIIVSAISALFTMEAPTSNGLGNTVQMEAAGNITFSMFYGV